MVGIEIALATVSCYAQTTGDYYQSGLNFYQQKQYDKAVSYFQAATQRDPLDWKSFQMLGTADYFMKDNSGALSAVNQSLKLHPDNPKLQVFADQLKALIIPLTGQPL